MEPVELVYTAAYRWTLRTLTLTAPGGAGGGIKGPVGGGVLRARDVVEKDTRS